MARTKLHTASMREDAEAVSLPARTHAIVTSNPDDAEGMFTGIEDACPDIEEVDPIEPPRRVLDSLLGFSYLDSFDELQMWSKNDVDPLARSNTPMLKRQPMIGSSSEKSSKVMLIHDYMGGYNRYEACQGANISSDLYSCEYLQHVETFVYFSHKLVTIPPPTWINTCHRNGVYCLGTFIVEPGSKEAECILELDDLGSFWVAHQLAEIAKKYGFDGWLVNIEVSFPLLSWSVERMEGFLRQLRRELGIERRVVWYDALTTWDIVYYQNTLNSLNLTFALAAGSILTNYAWNPTLAKSAQKTAETSGLGVSNVYFGIDVWAQNTQTGRNRRVTFPAKGGGGTGTGLGLEALKELSLNAGIFAPGWSFEHFPAARSRAVERSVWLGEELPVTLPCECFPEHPHESVPYRQNGIVEHARKFPAGSRTFFHTDFTRAVNRTADETLFAHIGAQSVLPLPSTAVLKSSMEGEPRSGYRMYDRDVSTGLRSAPSRLVAFIHKSREPVVAGPVAALLPLFDLHISDHNKCELCVSFRHPERPACAVELVVQWEGQNRHYIELPNEHQDVQTIKAPLPTMAEPISGIFLRITCEDDRMLPANQFHVMELFSITIQPSRSCASCEITSLRLEPRGEGDMKHHRLVWNICGFEDDKAEEPSGVPFSAITGPCAYFTVEINGTPAGRAYALELLLPDSEEVRSRQEGTIEAQVAAIGFDGRTLGRIMKTLHWALGEEDWVLVEPEDFSN